MIKDYSILSRLSFCLLLKVKLDFKKKKLQQDLF